MDDYVKLSCFAFWQITTRSHSAQLSLHDVFSATQPTGIANVCSGDDWFLSSATSAIKTTMMPSVLLSITRILEEPAN